MDKQEKKFLAEQQKRLRPSECIKYITTIIDPVILADPLGAQIQSTLSTAGINSSPIPAQSSSSATATQRPPRSITWQRSVLRSPTETRTIDENYTLLVWPASELFANDLIQQIGNASAGRPSTLLVCGLAAHLRSQRGGSAVAGAQRIDRELTRLELLHGIGYRRCDTAADLAMTVLLFAKSVAETPYKQELARQHVDQSFYMAGDNRDCVAVQGTVGLASLWQHQLCKLPLVTLETAEAIIETYPMPRLLLDAYASIGDNSGADLLSNIAVRRAAGPLSNMRKIGPKLSKRVYDLYTSDDPEQII